MPADNPPPRPFHPTDSTGERLAEEIVELARSREPRCGTTRVIAIDGSAGAGKTTLAAAVTTLLRLSPEHVVHLDDLYPGWDGLAAAPGLLTDLVLSPIAQGRPGSYRRWDWYAGARAESVTVPVGPWLLVEGCASSVRPAGGYAAAVVWVAAPEDVRLQRGLARDGDIFAPHWRRWAAREDALFAADDTAARADIRAWTG